MKSKLSSLLSFACAAILLVGCGSKATVGSKCEALDAEAWNSSIWLSAVDAPVLEKWNHDRAADGASWFVSVVKNEGKVTSAKWMTTSLGVYEIYLNGKPVGNEYLKPGFTHVLKTRRSFTYYSRLVGR